VFQFVIDIYEGPKLVLRHIFFGSTLDESIHYYNSHMKSDEFMRDCINGGCFKGNVPCKAVSYWL
jgi:hypothetical protein